MSLTLQTVEALAPDQASLVAAKKLLSDKKWAGQGMSETTTTVWGECQGSGSKPYYVVIDVADHGYKCTCPSRKFPCKHALALMWRFVENADNFAKSPAPTWVSDWLSRRKKTTKTATDTPVNHNKSIDAISEESALCAEEAAKKQAAAQKRAAKTKANTDDSISAGLQELQGWLGDQLAGGVGAFLDNLSERIRQISARLVDAKASNLAAYMDELPAVILHASKARRAKVALAEFGRLHLLMMAWQRTPDDIDVRQAIHTTPNKDTVLQRFDVLRIKGVWQVVGEQTVSKKDGLISQATYLVRLKDEETPVYDQKNNPNFALLLDYYHPTSGIKKSPSRLGAYMAGELCYYPSQKPLRAFFTQVQTIPMTVSDVYFGDVLDAECAEPFTNIAYLGGTQSLAHEYAKHLMALPWVAVMPYLLAGGQIKQDDAKRYWYCGEQDVLLSNKSLPKIVQAGQLRCAFILWRGDEGELLSVVSEQWGFLAC